MAVDLTHPEIAHLLRWVQEGVVARFQLRLWGATDHDIARMVRRRELVAVHPGVYVNHTGRLTFAQREWAAVLAAHPGVLSGASALPGRRPEIIEVAVEPGRKVTVPRGVRLRRVTRLQDRIIRDGRPPRMTIEHGLILALSDLLARGDMAGAFAKLADVSWTRQTNPGDIRLALATYSRLAGRRMIGALLTDLETGANSVLERGYLQLIERAHGLPRGTRQIASDATGDRDTLRVTYGLVFGDACRTADWIGQVLHRKGWTGQVSHGSGCRNAA